MDARVRATQGAVAEEPEVTAGGRIASGTAIEDALALQKRERFYISAFLRFATRVPQRLKFEFSDDVSPMSTVSVIIPTFNRLGSLCRALTSVMAQTRPPDEVIVVDDGSSDGTAAFIAERYPQIKLIRHEVNSGVSKARNRGIVEARGEWLALLDSDDQWLPQKLETQWAAIEENPAYAIVHSDEIWIRNGRRVNPMSKHAKSGGMIFQQCLPLCVISPSAVMVHASVFREVGLFDETLPACEDYDMWLRICARKPVLYLDEPLILKYGGHLDQLSRKYWGMDRFRIQALRKVIESGALEPVDEQAAIAALIEKGRIYIDGAKKRNKHGEIQDYEQLLRSYSE